MSGIVYVVHCIDTEGPLYEAPTVPFEQLNRIFKIDIEPTLENLKKLQNGEIDLKDDTIAIKNLLDKHKISTKGTWEEIEQVLETITADEYRTILPDSRGNGWVYSWFCMDHVGFDGENPRRRDAGHHHIFDRYMKMVQEQNKGDIVQFHHHPVSLSGNFNDSGTAFWGSNNLNEILCRKIIDRKWFPSAFRPGFHTERPDSNWFLEQWIPFDYGNQSVRQKETAQKDLADGRFGDWRHAPLEWYPYHPAHDDYQQKGECRRWITRCLNMHARIREINLAEIEDAFQRAMTGQNAILAFTNHDYKDMLFEIEKVRNMLKIVSKKYPDIPFEYADAVTAMRKALELKEEKLSLDVKTEHVNGIDRLKITSKNTIWGPQPFLAIKSKSGKYYWDNLDFSDKNKWTYTFDNNTIFLKDVEKIGVAANNMYGACEVIVI